MCARVPYRAIAHDTVPDLSELLSRRRRTQPSHRTPEFMTLHTQHLRHVSLGHQTREFKATEDVSPTNHFDHSEHRSELQIAISPTNSTINADVTRSHSTSLLHIRQEKKCELYSWRNLIALAISNWSRFKKEANYKTAFTCNKKADIKFSPVFSFLFCRI